MAPHKSEVECICRRAIDDGGLTVGELRAERGSRCLAVAVDPTPGCGVLPALRPSIRIPLLLLLWNDDLESEAFTVTPDPALVPQV